VELWFANLLLGHVHLNTLSFKATEPPKSRVAGGSATGGLAASAPLHQPNHRGKPGASFKPKTKPMV
jgi:hypothetical protein